MGAAVWLLAILAVVEVTPMSELARTDPRSPAEVDEDRALARLMGKARIFAKVPGLKSELKDNPEATLAVLLSLEAFGLAPTITGLNLFDWIEGQPVPSAQLYQGLAALHGYDLTPKVRTAERAVARIDGKPSGPIEVEFTRAMAARSRRLDEWVEQWEKDRESGKWRKPATWVVRRDGAPLEDQGDMPTWAAEAVKQGRVKRFDAWWNYPEDMLWKSAAKRAIKLYVPHILIGGGASADVAHDPVVRYHSPAAAIIEATEIPGPASPRVPAAPARASRPGGIPEEVYDNLPEANGEDDLEGDGRPFE